MTVGSLAIDRAAKLWLCPPKLVVVLCLQNFTLQHPVDLFRPLDQPTRYICVVQMCSEFKAETSNAKGVSRLALEALRVR